MSGSKISLTLNGARRPPPPPSRTNGVKRPRAALHDEEDDGAEDGSAEAEMVSHFDKAAGGAIESSDKKRKQNTAPLTIAPQANRNWRDQANQRKRQKSGLPEGHANNGADLDLRMRDVEAQVERSKPQFGLNTYTKKEDDVDVPAAPATEVEQTRHSPVQQATDERGPRQKTDDELAMDALLGETTTDQAFVIKGNDAPTSEADAFNHDIASAPAAATLDDYARVPVEQFGAALLRGLGWKDGEGIGSQRGQKLPKNTGKLPARRANLLGIGAKEDAAIASEMGVWGKASKGREVKIYNPVLIRDKRTGAMYTEEELEKKKQSEERAKYEMEFEELKGRRRRDDDGDHSRDRRREKKKEGDDDPRDHRRRRTRDDDDDDDHDHRHDHRDKERKRHDSESDDDEHSRRKEKERRRRKDRERDSDHQYYDRERSRRNRDDDHGHDDENNSRYDRRRDKDRRDRERDRRRIR